MPYSVPPLPYDYAALEPHIDEQTMRIHHDKHHQAYVDPRQRRPRRHRVGRQADRGRHPRPSRRFRRTSAASLRNHGGGHLNHTLFWNFMSPTGAAVPRVETSQPRSTPKFGSFDAFKAGLQGRGHRTSSARAGPGSSRTPRASRSSRRPNQDNPVTNGMAPLLGRRRLGTRVLPQLPEPPPGLPRRVVERRRLGRRRTALRRLRPAHARGRGGEGLPRKR